MRKTITLILIMIVLGSPAIASFWDTVFRGLGYEKMFLRMDNGKMLEYTSYNKTTIDRTDFFMFLKKKGYDVSQVKVCIHNHPYSRDFSEGDRLFYTQIKDAGFKGIFQVYFRGKVYTLKDKKER